MLVKLLWVIMRDLFKCWLVCTSALMDFWITMHTVFVSDHFWVWLFPHITVFYLHLAKSVMSYIGVMLVYLSEWLLILQALKWFRFIMLAMKIKITPIKGSMVCPQCLLWTLF